ncbi:MAG TPA: hypothetical protein VMT61_18015 [Candidatus Binataceae bacterium]|nr:hypothetical protein [Candidatus Binataceae bacterium]
MRIKRFLLLGLIPVASCYYAGHLSPKIESGPHGEQYRAGIVSYANDAHAAGRRADALKKIQKFCGGPYTIQNEGGSLMAKASATVIKFRCDEGGSDMEQPAK